MEILEISTVEIIGTMQWKTVRNVEHVWLMNKNKNTFIDLNKKDTE